MEIIKNIAALAPIIIVLFLIKNEWLSWRTSKKRRAKRTPNNQQAKGSETAKSRFNQRGLSGKPWFVLLISLLCMAYVLPEAFSPGELTRMALYKIVMGIGLFFFLLIQSSILNIAEVIFRMKTADFDLVKKFIEPTKIKD